MEGSKFVMHHVGGRAGTRAFPLISGLEHEFLSVMYEASTDGNEQIVSYGDQRGTGKTILVNACVGRPSKNRVFYLNRDPYTSSLFKLDPKYKNYYIQAKDYDYMLGQAISTHKEEVVNTESLDDLIQASNLPDCDFLSIDTQGSELEILQHAEKTLANCVGVKLEVSFVKRYKDQPLFGDIDKFLVDRGFHFIRFTKLKEWSSLEVGVEFRGEKMQIETDALYFKEPHLLLESQFYSAVFTALAFGQTEYALFISRNFKDRPNPFSGCAWMEFCDLFFEKAELSPNKRKSFDDALSLDQSFARFVNIDPMKIQTNDFKSRLRKLFWQIPVPIRSFLQRIENFLRKRNPRLLGKSFKKTEIEKLYESVGLFKLSKSLRRSRGLG